MNQLELERHTELRRARKLTRSLLQDARSHLPALNMANENKLTDFYRYVDENKFELALELIVTIGESCDTTPVFWNAVSRVVQSMSANETEFGKKLRAHYKWNKIKEKTALVTMILLGVIALLILCQ